MPATNEVSRWEHQLCTPRTVLRAWVLVLLYERPAHGYDLTTRLKELRFTSTPSRIYRALHWLENTRLIEPGWETGRGPARRVYTITMTGRHALEVLTPTLQIRAKTLDGEMARRVKASIRAIADDRRCFELIVTARLSVLARDEAAARRKLERVFARARPIVADVRTTGEVAICLSQPGAVRESSVVVV